MTIYSLHYLTALQSKAYKNPLDSPMCCASQARFLAPRCRRPPSVSPPRPSSTNWFILVTHTWLLDSWFPDKNSYPWKLLSTLITILRRIRCGTDCWNYSYYAGPINLHTSYVFAAASAAPSTISTRSVEAAPSVRSELHQNRHVRITQITWNAIVLYA